MLPESIFVITSNLSLDQQKIMESTEVEKVAKKFIEANCYHPQTATTSLIAHQK